jgi:hypothetical protein
MRLFFVALAVGVPAGLLLGGRLRHLASLELRAPLLVVLALAMQVGAGLAPRSARFPVVATSYALAGAWFVLNTRRRPLAIRIAVGLLAVGWLLNVAAIVPNRGMPVSAAAVEQVQPSAKPEVEVGQFSKHVDGYAASPLRWLGDVLPVRPLGAVISVGDVFLLVGLAWCIAAGMRSAAPELLPTGPGGRAVGTRR